MKHIYFILTFLTVFSLSCGTENKTGSGDKAPINKASFESKRLDQIRLREASNQEDLPVNEYLTEQLKPIRENFKRINSITKWASIDTKELSETTESGEAKYYYQNGQLEKIVAQYFGETFQQLIEFYLLNGKLSFVFEKSYKYNRPMYYDSTSMKENNDTEAYDLEQSKIIEVRNYFENGTLIHQINNHASDSLFSSDYLLKEQKRITAEFRKLIGKTNNK